MQKRRLLSDRAILTNLEVSNARFKIVKRRFKQNIEQIIKGFVFFFWGKFVLFFNVHRMILSCFAQVKGYEK